MMVLFLTNTLQSYKGDHVPQHHRFPDHKERFVRTGHHRKIITTEGGKVIETKYQEKG